MPNYNETSFYLIFCKNENITDKYVGHTTNFKIRKYHHKRNSLNKKSKNYNLKVYDCIRANGGLDNWEMVEIEKCSCENVIEAKAIEAFWIKTLETSLNDCIPLRTQKDHYEENKEYKLNYQKAYAIEHKEEIKEYKKNYAILYKDDIAEKSKTYHQTNKERITLQRKEYRKLNRERIALQEKAYREANKESYAKRQHDKYERRKLKQQQQKNN
jgi:hypothetical protein